MAGLTEQLASLKLGTQQHLVTGWEHLSATQQARLLADLKEQDWEYVQRIFEASMQAAGAPVAHGVEPVTDVLSLQVMCLCSSCVHTETHAGITVLQDGTVEQWQQHGLHLIAEVGRQLCCAGPQGS
jgi:hypothetical protein